MKFFSPESKLYKAMVGFTDAVKLSLLWFVFSLPIITSGASTAAAFSVAMKMLKNEEGHISSDFWSAFKANIKQGIAMSFITIICAWVLYLDFQIFNSASEHNTVFLIIGIIAAYVFSFSLLYAFPLIARYENTLLNTIRNSFRISMKFFLRSLLLIVAVALEAAVFLWNTKTLIVGVIIGPAVIITTISWVANGIFEKLEKEPGSIR